MVLLAKPDRHAADRELDPMFVELIGDLLKQLRKGSITELGGFVKHAGGRLLARAAQRTLAKRA